jgi:hypothetical protein
VTPAELGLARFAAEPAPAPRVRLIGFRARSESDPMLFAPSRDAAFPPTPGTILATSACRSAIASGTIGLGYIAAGDSSRDLVDRTGIFRAVTAAGLPFVDPGKRRPRGDWDDDGLRS